MRKRKMGSNKALGSQIIKGGFWIVTLEISNQALQFLKTFYAASVLTPVDFGILGIVFLIIAGIEVLSTTGMKEAIIQKQTELTSYVSAVWMVEILKGTTVLLLAVLLNPVIIKIANPADPYLMRNIILFVGGFYFVQCLTNVGVVYFEKQLQFNKYFVYQFSGTIADVIASLLLVYYFESVWGLLMGALAGAVVRVLFSFILAEVVPGIEFNWAKTKELFQYGKWILKGRLFNFLGLQSDSILVSTFFSVYILGIYQMAFRIGNLPMAQVSNIIGRIAFPAFAKVHHDSQRLKDYFLTALSVLSLLLMLLVILVFCFIPEFTILFLGEKWIKIVPFVRVLIIAGFLRILVSLVDSLFCANDKPKFSSEMQQTRFILFAVMVFPWAYFTGAIGVALSAMASLLVVFIVFFKRAYTMLSMIPRELYDNLIFPLTFGATLILPIMAFKFMFPVQNILGFALHILFSAVIYVIGGYFISTYTSFKLYDRVMNILKYYK